VSQEKYLDQLLFVFRPVPRQVFQLSRIHHLGGDVHSIKIYNSVFIVFRTLFCQTWPQDLSRRARLEQWCITHLKLTLETHSNAISKLSPLRPPKPTQNREGGFQWVSGPEGMPHKPEGVSHNPYLGPDYSAVFQGAFLGTGRFLSTETLPQKRRL
jgi:hypothetical protein